jgi:hypothetical protein
VSDPVLDEVTLTLHLNTTVQINGMDFIKPGCSISHKFRGKDRPSDQQLIDSFEWMLSKAIMPVMEEMLVLSNEKVAEARRHGFPVK